MSIEESPSHQQAGTNRIGGMSPEEIAALLAGGVVGRLGCLDDDGWPYVVPTWFQYADGGFYIVPRERSAWARYLQRDSRCSLCIDTTTARSRRVIVKGQAELVEEPNVGGRWVEIARQMAIRYMGENGPRYLDATLNEPRWLFFIRPITMVSWQGGGWARKYKHYQWS